MKKYTHNVKPAKQVGPFGLNPILLDAMTVAILLLIMMTISYWLTKTVPDTYVTTVTPIEDVVITSNQTQVLKGSPIIDCDKLKLMYDKAYLQAIPNDSKVNFGYVDDLFYNKYKECK